MGTRTRKDDVVSYHSDLIYEMGSITIYRQGYGFYGNDEMSAEEVATIVKDEGLKGMLNAVGRSALRRYL